MPTPPGPPKEDYYNFSNWWFWIIALSINFYLLCVILYHVLLANNAVFHSFVSDIPAGHWVDYRFNDIEWYTMFGTTFKIFMFLSVNFAIKSRRSRGCYTIWTASIVIIAFVQMLSVFGFLFILSNCNASGNRHSICNDKRFCCAPTINADPANHCTNLIPCPPIVTQIATPFTEANLSPNEDFKWLLATNVFFFLFDAGYVLFFILGYRDVDDVEKMEEEKEEVEAEVAGQKENNTQRQYMSKKMRNATPSLIKKET